MPFPANKSHNFSGNYYECLAKVTLGYIFPDKYDNLIKSERPDFISDDGSIGVEVTRAIHPLDAEKDSFFSKHLLKKNAKEIDKNRILSFCSDGTRLLLYGKIGGVPTDKIIGCSYGMDREGVDLITDAIEKKYKLLNEGGYQNCSSFALYVLIHNGGYYEEYEIDQIFRNVLRIAEVYEKIFDIVYIDAWDDFYVFDMINKTMTKTDKNDSLATIKKAAIEMAEKLERGTV